MKTSGNTVLITGGSAGIGLAIAKLLTENNNKVIITGRNPERLAQAAKELPGVSTIVSDVTNGNDVTKLVHTLQKDFPALNILINNAGKAYAYQLSDTANAADKATDEMVTNYFAVIRLTEQLLPLLRRQPEAAIVNVTSIVAFAPSAGISTYAASKAALRSYTLSLRHSIAPLRVFELMPPLVNTAFSEDIGGANGIPPQQVASEFLAALEKDEFEIRVGDTEQIYQLSLSSPAAAFAAMNQGRNA
ncbi:SDR family oxidoreductase [Chitinophaga sp. 22321]|uniref:SDR family NAD(P)-dependent oxidoreductase n=1 Tax=Chitinophaga hostae TaxID=2831022 RepID=A0ABS5J912_9BACT|nr:SDR family NAD(P)-dependent oxidoreductase [Chitinophaga hostae]MBS0031581.1 SDR family NAD(P)-dependent oxidoreductase [Chitinophaga hostae]